MPKHFYRGMILSLMILSVAGCVTARTYISDRERVDQQISGNAGYLMGTPVVPDRSHLKKTKRIYVLELQTKAPEEEGGIAEEASPVISPELSEQEEYTQAPVSPKMKRSVVASEEAPVRIPKNIQYTVLKNDTLQKISKKFYGGYSKWTKIYKANEKIIKDPNHIKPGLVITIPDVVQK